LVKSALISCGRGLAKAFTCQIDPIGIVDDAVDGHLFRGEEHEKSERKTWAVIGLCGAMMIAEIVGGLLFGSIADGLHMRTHAGALLLAALAYTYARKHVEDPKFTFGTGKFGDLAGFTSAIVLAMIAILIGYELVSRIFDPVPIRFAEAIPIAVLGLAVNVASAWLLGGGDHQTIITATDTGMHIGVMTMMRHITSRRAREPSSSMCSKMAPPRFRFHVENGPTLSGQAVSIETIRPDGALQFFDMEDQGGYLESIEEIPEPHEFIAHVRIDDEDYSVRFEKHEHAQASAQRDNNMRAAVVHVIADAAISVLVIVGLLQARAFGWLWMDPIAGIIGAFPASWSKPTKQ
jgi:cation diffusion facilitator family transporter